MAAKEPFPARGDSVSVTVMKSGGLLCLRSCSIPRRTPQGARGAHRQRFPLPATASPPSDTASLSVSPRQRPGLLSPAWWRGLPSLCSPLPTQLSLPPHHNEQDSIRSSLWRTRTDPGLWDGGRRHPGRRRQSPWRQLAGHGTAHPGRFPTSSQGIWAGDLLRSARTGHVLVQAPRLARHVLLHGAELHGFGT